MPRSRMFAVLAAALAASAIATSASGGPIEGDKFVKTWLLVPLTGAAEVPGPGANSASGTATVQIDAYARKVCYALDTSNLDAITAAHIHKAPAGQAGAPVVTLRKAMRGDAWDGCVDVGQDEAKEIIANPADYYLNVHTAAFPAGALRVQLGG